MIYGILLVTLFAVAVWYFEFRAFAIPVLYYHHVEPTDPVTPGVFESQMKYLLSKGYNSLSLNELYGFMTGVSRVPRKSFALTFDDGFYCNYHYLFPILEKYKLKATIFAVSGVRKQSIGAGQRERSRGYPSRTGTNMESAERFATWDELNLMIASGLVQTEDHGLFHDRVYRNDNARGFNTGIELDWSVWGDTRPGTVRYEAGSSLAHKKFTGDYKLNDYLVKLVKDRSLDLSENNTVRILKKTYLEYKKQNPVKFIYESEDNYMHRCRMDIEKSRTLIEERTGVVPMFFCFPWGDYNKTVIGILKGLGSTGARTTDTGAKGRGGNPYKIKRLKIYRSNLAWFKRYFFLHRSRILVTLYSLFYGWF
jgi:peptidoglycan/xylan/chitin deacetylase (PgdA/CDA1 family)